MKRYLPTFVLLLICIGGFWYASSRDFFKETPKKDDPVVVLNKSEVTGFTVRLDNQETELQRKDGKWSMVRPVTVPLNESSVDNWLNSFVLVSKGSVIDENPTDVTPYGLGKPNKQFTVKLQNGQEQTLLIGDATAIKGSFYAKLSDQPAVFRVEEARLKPLSIAAEAFMEKRPIQFTYDEVEKVVVSWKGRSWTLAKGNPAQKSYESDWTLGERTIKGSSVSTYLDKVQLMTTEQLAKRRVEVMVQPPNDSDLRIDVQTSGTGKMMSATYTGQLATTGDVVWLAKDGDEWAYAIQLKTIEELANADQAPPVTAETNPAIGNAPVSADGN